MVRIGSRKRWVEIGPRDGLDWAWRWDELDWVERWAEIGLQPPRSDAREASVRVKKEILGNLLCTLVLESWIVIRTWPRWMVELMHGLV